MTAMRPKKKIKETNLNPGQETLGQRIARLRKGKTYTQVEMAKKMGVTQGLVSDYELDKLRPHPEIIIKFAQILEVTTDELLGVKSSKGDGNKASLKVLRRIKKIDELPPYQQKIILKTIDTFLKGAER